MFSEADIPTGSYLSQNAFYFRLVLEEPFQDPPAHTSPNASVAIPFRLIVLGMPCAGAVVRVRVGATSKNIIFRESFQPSVQDKMRKHGLQFVPRFLLSPMAISCFLFLPFRAQLHFHCSHVLPFSAFAVRSVVFPCPSSSTLRHVMPVDARSTPSCARIT